MNDNKILQGILDIGETPVSARIVFGEISH